MDWSKLYGADNRPTLDDISGLMHNDLWREMNSFLQCTYSVEPQMLNCG